MDGIGACLMTVVLVFFGLFNFTKRFIWICLLIQLLLRQFSTELILLINAETSTSQDKDSGIEVVNETTLNKFPVELYQHYLKFRLTPSRIGGLSSNDITTRLVTRLYSCVHTDSRCALCLGTFYFQGLVPQGTIQEDSEGGKSLIRALALWYDAAKKGNSEAQYYMGLIFSSYFNPPPFLYNPEELHTRILNNEPLSLFESNNDTHNLNPLLNNTFITSNQIHSKKNLSINQFNNASIELISQTVSSIDIERLYSTMRVLDSQSLPKLEEIENQNVQDLLSQINQFNIEHNMVTTSVSNHSSFYMSQIKGTSTEIENKTLLTSLKENNLNQPLLKRFPLYRRDSLAILYFYAAAQSGHIGAQLALGFRHQNGLGVPKRCHTASAYYLRVAREVANLSSNGIPPAGTAVRLSLSGLSVTARNEKMQLSDSSEMKSHYLDLQFHVAETGDPRVQTAVGKIHLFGIGDFPQDFSKALHYFQMAAQKDNKDAVAYLGYLYALGLGVEQDLNLAFKLFNYGIKASQDVLSHNGLGYIYFKGTETISIDLHKSIYHFNISATRGFPDAQYNLGALYLSGVGLQQSFSKGLHWLSKALEQGHTAAAYLMGIIHLNGMGTLRDCSLATALFKRVAERHLWVTQHLHKATLLYNEKRLDETGFNYWILAEAGHEISQLNLGTLLDGGGTRPLFFDRTLEMKGLFQLKNILGLLRRVVSYIPFLNKSLYTPISLFSLDRYFSIGVNRVFAQRYWDMAASQNSPQGYARLGDYAFHGWGVVPATIEPSNLTELGMLSGLQNDKSENIKSSNIFIDNNGDDMSGWGVPRSLLSSLYYLRLKPEYHKAFHFYDRATQLPNHGGTAATYPAQSQYAVGHMYQFGAGVPQDLHVARRRFSRVTELDAELSTIPGKLTILFLRLHAVYLYMKQKTCWGIFYDDPQVFLIAVNLIVLSIFLLVVRPIVKRHIL